MKLITQRAELAALRNAWARAGESVGVVPTMGALHPGHLSLVTAAKADCDRVIVTIFVNPKQFNDPEDLKNYPRTEADDAKLLKPFDVDVLYVPEPDQVYPDGFATNVRVGGISEKLEGSHRLGHFDGVATVVTKLFTQTRADRAYFGEKDYQQLQLVTRLSIDLDLGVDVVGCPTIRDDDGLAMSSRNRRLTKSERAIAPALINAMKEAAKAIRGGGDVDVVLSNARSSIESAGFNNVDYIELRDAHDLTRMDQFDRPARLLAAAYLGEVRLIDNLAV